jgi:molybdate transport repressor ModE-like protein
MSTRDRSRKLKPNYKLWYERDGEYIFGPGACAILKAIHEEGTITKGAKKLGMSYRYAWGVIKKIEQKLGLRVVETYKGGTVGGGGAKVTEYGLMLIDAFTTLNSKFEEILNSSGSSDL